MNKRAQTQFKEKFQQAVTAGLVCSLPVLPPDPNARPRSVSDPRPEPEAVEAARSLRQGFHCALTMPHFCYLCVQVPGHEHAGSGVRAEQLHRAAPGHRRGQPPAPLRAEQHHQDR